MAETDAAAAAAEEIAALQARLRLLAIHHWSARALHAAVALGMFEALRGSPIALEQLCETIHTAPQATGALLTALVALGLVEKEADRYRATRDSALLLGSGAAHDQSDLIKLFAGGWRRWEYLADSVRTGKPSAAESYFDGDLVHAMYSTGAVIAPLVARRLDFTEVRRLLDIGGAPAAYAIAFARAWPELQVEVLDLTEANQISDRYIQSAGLQDRIRTPCGDYFTADYGSGFDLAVMSNVIHLHSPAEARSLLYRALGALAPGGRCAVNEFLLNDEKTGPLMPALFGLHMLLNTETGSTYSGAEIAGFMREVGFARPTVLDLPPTPYSIVVGYRP